MRVNVDLVRKHWLIENIDKQNNQVEKAGLIKDLIAHHQFINKKHYTYSQCMDHEMKHQK
jgi:uncharacterized protein affecting Mg2+/Co2+ transport